MLYFALPLLSVPVYQPDALPVTDAAITFVLAAALDTKLAVVDAPTVTLYVSSTEPEYVPDTVGVAVDPLLHALFDTDAADADPTFNAAPDTSFELVDAPTPKVQRSSVVPV